MRGEDIVEERSLIDSEELVSEYVMLGLRLSRGICAQEYKSLSGRELEADMPMIKSFIASGFLQDCGGRISFTDKGFFVSNAILAQLLDQLK